MTSAIIVAAGTSQRMGFDKLFALLQGKPVLLHSIEAFEKSESIDEIIVVTQQGRENDVEKQIAQTEFKKVRHIVEGGSQRHLSVWQGMQAVEVASSFIAVHDAARPLIRPETINKAVEEARKYGAVSVATPVVDTLKRANESEIVIDSVDREQLWAMQTPQIFRSDWLIEAYQRLMKSGETVTDEVSAVQAAGFEVKLVLNLGWNLKITFPRDLELAALLLELQKKS